MFASACNETFGASPRRPTQPLYPHTQDHSMSQDDTDGREERSTDASPPMSDRQTQPPGSDDAAATRALGTMIPPANKAVAMPPDWWEGSFFQKIFNDLERGVTKLSETKDGYDAILSALGANHEENRANWEAMRVQLDTWRKATDARDDLQDERIAELERQLLDAKAEVLARVESAVREAVQPYAKKIEQLEQSVEELKKRVPARSPSPAAT